MIYCNKNNASYLYRSVNNQQITDCSFTKSRIRAYSGKKWRSVTGGDHEEESPINSHVNNSFKPRRRAHRNSTGRRNCCSFGSLLVHFDDAFVYNRRNRHAKFVDLNLKRIAITQSQSIVPSISGIYTEFDVGSSATLTVAKTLVVILCNH